MVPLSRQSATEHVLHVVAAGAGARGKARGQESAGGKRIPRLRAMDEDHFFVRPGQVNGVLPHHAPLPERHDVYPRRAGVSELAFQ